MGALGGFEWVIIIVIILLLFGAKKIPDMARGIGQGIREFQKAASQDKEELENETERQKKEDNNKG